MFYPTSRVLITIHLHIYICTSGNFSKKLNTFELKMIIKEQASKAIYDQIIINNLEFPTLFMNYLKNDTTEFNKELTMKL